MPQHCVSGAPVPRQKMSLLAIMCVQSLHLQYDPTTSGWGRGLMRVALGVEGLQSDNFSIWCYVDLCLRLVVQDEHVCVCRWAALTPIHE